VRSPLGVIEIWQAQLSGMLFNSYEFIFLYLPVVLAGFFLLGLRRPRAAAIWLVIASLAFYGYWSIAALPLLVLSACTNYAFGKAIARATARDDRRAGPLLFAAVSLNLVVLGFFKYANFFVRVANHTISVAFHGHPLDALDIILPIGISFFTFTQIAFLVDCREGKVRETNFTHYLLFVTYFPHLIAGPIIHHAQMMPQFARRATYALSADNIAAGLILFTIGLVKKVLVADGDLATYSNAVFNAAVDGAEPQAMAGWAAAVAYTLRIYFDFSGYTDMALGLSKLFNIELPINFASPFQATNIIEFWRRWHMSLSAFLRDYLYIPLGGNRKGKLRRHINLLITMLLGGLWHGAGGTFVVWGGLHGLYLVANHLWRDMVPRGLEQFLPRPLARAVGVVFTFASVAIAFVWFRAAGTPAALHMLKGMFGFSNAASSDFGDIPLLALCLGMAWVWLLPASNKLVERMKEVKAAPWGYVESAVAVFYGLLFAIAVDAMSTHSEFLYFQF
jgi:alginate O-acetyltransferase complex protein AlgI